MSGRVCLRLPMPLRRGVVLVLGVAQGFAAANDMPMWQHGCPLPSCQRIQITVVDHIRLCKAASASGITDDGILEVAHAHILLDEQQTCSAQLWCGACIGVWLSNRHGNAADHLELSIGMDTALCAKLHINACFWKQHVSAG